MRREVVHTMGAGGPGWDWTFKRHWRGCRVNEDARAFPMGGGGGRGGGGGQHSVMVDGGMAGPPGRQVKSPVMMG